MNLEELEERIHFESCQYTSIHDVKVLDEKGRELKNVKVDISNGKIIMIFNENIKDNK